MAGEDIVVLGRLFDPYGVKGWLRLHAFGDDPLRWAEMPVWWVGQEGGPWQPRELRGLKAQGNGLVVMLDGVADRTAAEAMKGFLVGAPREALPETKGEEYYWADLIGLEVMNTADECLGKISGLIETGANDVLRVVADDATERLIPFVDAVVLSIDREAGSVRVAWGLDW